jgi:hypothetical protein
MYGILKKIPVKLVEQRYCRNSRRIQENNIKGIAAIAGTTAAKCMS